MKKMVAFVGPSGVGKTCYIRRLLAARPFALPRVATTRPRRDDDGNYVYLTPTEFNRLAAAGELAEHDQFSGYAYGTIRSSISWLLANDQVRGIALDLTPNGYVQLSKNYPQAQCLALIPDDPAWLMLRLKGRGTDSSGEIAKRMAEVRLYLEQVAQLSCIQLVINSTDSYEQVFARLLTLIGE